MVPEFLRELTEPQRQAVTFGEGPLLVLAGPGSGKTRVITYRIAYLLSQGVAHHQILALAFTNKAAQEIADRVARLTGQTGVWVGTFHGFCSRFLRKYARLVGLEPNFTIYDDEQSDQILRKVISRVTGGKSPLPFSSVSQAIHHAKNNLQLPEFFRSRDPSLPSELVGSIYAEYQEELRRLNAVDFDDLLLHVARMLGEQPEIRAQVDEQFRFVLVDEYQDTNLAQYAIVRAICVDYPNLTVAGDPDQSIYCWRGASIRNILEFEHDYPHVTVVRLEENYRSTGRILHAADQLISRNTRRKPKRLFTYNPPGQPIRLLICRTEEDEAATIATEIAEAVHNGRRQFRDFAIFFRVAALAGPVEMALKRARIPYQVVNAVEFFRRKEIQDVLAYLRLVVNPKDDEAFLRLVQAPPRGIGQRTLEQLITQARRQGLALAELLQSELVNEGVSSRVRKPLQELRAFLDLLFSARYPTLAEFVEFVLEQSGYRAWLRQSGLEGEERLRHLDEFLSAVRDFDKQNPGDPDLARFLEETALLGEPDRWDDAGNRVWLLTLHAAKGLEFPVVYIIGLEQGLLPYEESWRDMDELEEERRLLFVGMTRAREELVLTRAIYRNYRGQRRLTIPSPFLLELPREELVIQDHSDENVGFVFALPAQVNPGGDPGSFATAERSKPAACSRRDSGIFVAADYFGERQSLPSGWDLTVGTVVLHPQYGIGRVVNTSDQGPEGALAIRFPPPIGLQWIKVDETELRVLRHLPGSKEQSEPGRGGERPQPPGGKY